MKNDLSQAKKLIQECKKSQNPYLDLGYCGITKLKELPELFECAHIETLILSNHWWDNEKGEVVKSQNKGIFNSLISISSHILKFKKLINLRICGTYFYETDDWDIWNIYDISILKKLTQLQTLDLSINQLSNISFLEDLTQLQTLVLSINQIEDISSLRGLTKLQSLDLRHNKVSDISFIEELTNLQSLYLDSNNISDISFLEKLTQLQILYLRLNQILVF